MALVPLSVLLAPETQPEALSTLLGIANFLGLSTSAWQPLGMIRTTYATIAQVIANYTSQVSQQAAGGYATLAAQMPGNGAATVDSQGYLTTWMDLVSTQVFNVPRNPATQGAGNVYIKNNTGTLQSGGAGTLHFASPNVPGLTYSNTLPYVIAGNSPGTPVPVKQDTPGAGAAPIGTVLSTSTPITGCVVLPLIAALVGNAAETNAALLVRCIAKLGSLSPNGAPGSYTFVATSLPQTALASAIPPYSVSATITRIGLAINKTTGIVQSYLANASGPAPGPDVAAVNAAVQAFCVPNAQTVRSGACTTFALTVNATAYVPAASGITPAQVQAAAATAVTTYCSNMPVGGVSTSVPNQLPRDALISFISLAIALLSPAYAQNISVTLQSPLTDSTLLFSDVPVSTTTCTMVAT